MGADTPMTWRESLDTNFAGGGVSAGLRDLGRLGLVMLDKGRSGDRQPFPARVVDTIATGGDRAKSSGSPTLPGGR